MNCGCEEPGTMVTMPLEWRATRPREAAATQRNRAFASTPTRTHMEYAYGNQERSSAKPVDDSKHRTRSPTRGARHRRSLSSQRLNIRSGGTMFGLHCAFNGHQCAQPGSHLRKPDARIGSPLDSRSADLVARNLSSNLKLDDAGQSTFARGGPGHHLSPVTGGSLVVDRQAAASRRVDDQVGVLFAAPTVGFFEAHAGCARPIDREQDGPHPARRLQSHGGQALDPRTQHELEQRNSLAPSRGCRRLRRSRAMRERYRRDGCRMRHVDSSRRPGASSIAAISAPRIIQE